MVKRRAHFCDLLVVFVKGLAVLPVEEGGDAHNFFLLIDDWQRQDILDGKAGVVHWPFLEHTDK